MFLSLWWFAWEQHQSELWWTPWWGWSLWNFHEWFFFFWQSKVRLTAISPLRLWSCRDTIESEEIGRVTGSIIALSIERELTSVIHSGIFSNLDHDFEHASRKQSPKQVNNCWWDWSMVYWCVLIWSFGKFCRRKLVQDSDIFPMGLDHTQVGVGRG